MVMIRTVQVRLTRDQYERLKNNAHARGFDSLSSFVRHVTLHHDALLEKKVFEIHEHLLGKPRRRPKDEVPPP